MEPVLFSAVDNDKMMKIGDVINEKLFGYFFRSDGYGCHSTDASDATNETRQ